MKNLHRFAPLAASLAVVGACALVTGCQTDASMGTKSERAATERTELDQRAANTIASFKEADPGMQKFFSNAAGYVVFPKVSEGALIVGGSHGDGVLFEGGKPTADVDVSAGSVGAQIGGQVYSEIIFFQTQNELQRFKSGNFEFDAKASAVAVRAGASASADYVKGVAIFAFSEKGLMAQAALGGQKFDVEPR